MSNDEDPRNSEECYQNWLDHLPEVGFSHANDAVEDFDGDLGNEDKLQTVRVAQVTTRKKIRDMAQKKSMMGTVDIKQIM
jgi:hypothetical protein